MSQVIDQKAYLQKYLTGKSSDKKKKKKKLTKGKGFQIIDDDLDISKLRPLDMDELDILNEGEDAPQIAGIIDERPDEIKNLEDFKTSSKWRVINQDDGFNSKLQVEEVKRNEKEIEKENEIVFGKMYSDSEDDNKNDSDPSPPRKNSEKNQSRSSKNKYSDSDCSPPRKKEKKKINNYDSDPSPPRSSKQRARNNLNRRDSDASPPRRGNSSKQAYDSDQSPPRKREKLSKEDDKVRKVRKPSRWGDFEAEKNEYEKLKHSRSYESSNRRSNEYRSPDESRRSNQQASRGKDYDSDLSPPRKTKRYSPKRNSQHSDESPPRRIKSSDNKRIDNQDKYRKNNDRRRDLSPKNKRSEPKKQDRRQEKRYESDSDLSPPRRDKGKSHGRDYRNDEPPPSNKKMEKTLEGKKAGLQDAGQLKEENQAFRRREDEAFKNMTDEMSGRNAKAVSRKGKRETSEDRQKQRDKAERQKELDEKYKKWSKGVKQIEAQEAAVQDFIHEASKPLARYKDDRDLEDKLKDVERDGDPMLQYMREKKRERGELGPERPTYKGNFPPNRFNIRPGYRWDGVDRSNGYEKKFFDQQSKKKAQEEEVYKWSTEDL